MSLLIIYNASGTLLGHAAYAYHHLAGTPEKSCAACAITHGPRLSLSESEGWVRLKGRIENGDSVGEKLSVRQMHKEDMEEKIKAYLRTNQLSLPVVLIQRDNSLETVLTKPELDGIGGDLTKFETGLRESLGTQSRL